MYYTDRIFANLIYNVCLSDSSPLEGEAGWGVSERIQPLTPHLASPARGEEKIRRSSSLAALLCLVCILCFPSTAHAAVADDLQYAAALFNDGEYRQALDEFTRLRPSLAGAEWEDDVLFWTAECHFYLQEYPQSLEIYQKLISDYPAFPRLEDAYVKIMGVHYAAARFDKVLDIAETFSKKYPNSASKDQAYLLWIQSALRLKQFTRAEELLDAYQKSFPGSPYVWSLKSILANFYLKDQRFDRALPFFEELYSYQKDDNFLLWIGECRFQTGAWAGARDAFAQFLQVQPQNDVARFKLGLSEYRAGNFKQAVDALQILAEKENGFTEDALYFMAQSLIRLGNTNEAKKNLSNILKLKPNEELRSRAVAQIVRIETATGEGDIDKMLQTYENLGAAASPEEIRKFRVISAYRKQDFRAVIALILEPKDRREWLMLAESLYSVGNYPEASQKYSQLLASSAAAAEKRPAYAGLGWCAYAQEQFEEALKMFQAYLAVAAEPSPSADVHLAMAQCAMSLGRTDQAILFYDRARKSSSDSQKITRNLGILYFNSGDYRRAAELLEPMADDDQILSVVGRAYVYLKQPARALTFFRKLKHPERYSLEIAAVHYELGQLEEAKTYFEQAAQAPGVSAGVNVDEFLGIIAYNQGNYAEAATRLRRAQLKDPGNIEIRFELAASLMKVENAPQQELIEILRSLISSPSVPRGYKDKAKLWLSRKSTTADMSEIRNIENREDREMAILGQATRYFSQPAYETAAVYYEELLAMPGIAAESRMQGLYGLGWSQHKLGRKSAAQETFRTILADYPKSSYAAEIVLLLVEDAYGTGRYAEAADLAVKYVNKTSKNAARLRFMAAESLYETERYADALAYYRAFLPDADNLADYARYRAGLAAFRLRQYDPSVEFFSAISDSSLLERKYYYLGMSFHSQGKKKKAFEQFENVVGLGSGDFQEEAWKNLIILMEDLGMWAKAISYGTRLSESPRELDRLIYCEALSNTNSSMTARYCEKLSYLAKDPDIAAQALYLSGMSLIKTDDGKGRQLLEKLIQKYPKSRFAADARKFLGKPE